MNVCRSLYRGTGIEFEVDDVCERAAWIPAAGVIENDDKSSDTVNPWNIAGEKDQVRMNETETTPRTGTRTTGASGLQGIHNSTIRKEVL